MRTAAVEHPSLASQVWLDWARRNDKLAGMVDTAGRQRIAQLVRAGMAWQGLSKSRLEASGHVQRGIADRVRLGDPTISDAMLRELATVLGFPSDFLLDVGLGDVGKVAASAGDPDLIRWTIDLLRADQRDG